MKPLVFAFSGAIASGKTTLATHLAHRLACPSVSFGVHVRAIARSWGLDDSRHTLQMVGAKLIESGWEDFCRAVLSEDEWQPGQHLVVDGIRHVEAVLHLKKMVSPNLLLLIYVSVNENERTKRKRQRRALAGDTGLDNEAHPTERYVAADLPEIADLTVNGADPVDEVVNQILAFAITQES